MCLGMAVGFPRRFTMLVCLIIGCSVLGVFSQNIDFTGNPGNVNENAGTVTFNIVATSNIGTSSAEVKIEVQAAATAAAGYDFGGTGTYTVTIPVGMNTGALVLAVEDDSLSEPAETINLRITGVTGGGAAAVAGTLVAATTILVDGADTDKVRVDFVEPVYATTEDMNANMVMVRFTDAMGNPTVLNGATNLNLALSGASSDDTATAGGGNDFTDPTGGMVTLTFDESTTTQTLAAITINDDSVAEPTEVFHLSLSSLTVGTYAQVGTTRTRTQIRIHDNDVESLICLSKPEVFRRTRGNVEFYAFTSLTADRASIGWTKSNFDKGTLANQGTDGMKLTVARPGKRSSRRFGSYTFTATGTSNAALSCNTFLRGKSEVLNYPSEIAQKYTLVIYPTAFGSTTLSPELTFGIDCSKWTKTRTEIKWEKDGVRLRKQKRATMTVTTVDAAGVYLISRDNRGKKAWYAIIQLIASACPQGQYLDGTCMTCGGCYNGGTCSAAFSGGCVCPPCFEGEKCELVASDTGGFGLTTRTTCASLSLPSTCKGVLFSLPGLYGSSCACGWSGSDCGTECQQGFFGADCAQTCHCMTVANCNKITGVCSDAVCETGYTGENCQIPP